MFLLYAVTFLLILIQDVSTEIEKPKILILGAVGVGKSSLANVLLGRRHDHDASHKFSHDCFTAGQIRNDRMAMTKRACQDEGYALGDESYPKITIIDTPGVGSSAAEDEVNMDNLVQFLKKEVKYVNVFLLVFKESDNRMSEPFRTLIRLFVNIFGDDFWPNVVIEATFWSHSKSSETERHDYKQPLTEEYWTREHNIHLEREFKVKHKIPAVFIHPKYSKNNSREVFKFHENVAKLLNITMSKPKFELKDIKMALTELQEPNSQTFLSKSLDFQDF